MSHTSEKQKPFKCDICEKAFTRKSNLTSHRFIHADARPFTCKVCDKRFKTGRNYSKHQKQHLPEHSQAKHQCQICDRSFSKADHLRMHQVTHSEERPFECDICGRCFKTGQCLRRHRVQNHIEYCTFNVSGGGSSYFCKHCQTLWPTWQRLYFHLRSHGTVANRPFKCDLCLKPFNQSVHLSKHRQSIHSSNDHRPYKCRTCEKTFGRAEYLTSHEKSHLDTHWRHECDFCGVFFSRKEHLIHHRRIHTEEKPYSCDICKKKFKKQTEMANHQKTNCGTKPWKCQYEGCRVAFSEMSNLRRHRREVHDKSNVMKRYSCTACSKSFNSESMFYDHKRTDCDMKPMECGYNDCGFTTKYLGALRSHQKTKHA